METMGFAERDKLACRVEAKPGGYGGWDTPRIPRGWQQTTTTDHLAKNCSEMSEANRVYSKQQMCEERGGNLLPTSDEHICCSEQTTTKNSLEC